MSEVLTQTPPNFSTHERSPEMPMLPRGDRFLDNEIRDQQLRTLLGTDYDYAVESGLVDMFEYNEKWDGLLHVLAGNITTEDGIKMSEGMHHEPSATMIYGEDSQTKVDESHLEGANSKHRREFAEYPYEPYRARVNVEGVPKLTTKTITNEDGTTEEVTKPVNNGMFPKEYDALAIMQTIKQAMNNRLPNSDVTESQGNKVVVTEGYALMLDGKTPMKIKLVVDPVTDKIRTAFPIFSSPGSMKLGKEAVHNFLGLAD